MKAARTSTERNFDPEGRKHNESVSTYGAPGTRPRTEIHATRNGRHVVHPGRRPPLNRDKADYINIIAWRQTAEFVAKHFAKGQRVAIVGSIQTRSWEDNDGGKHKAVEIVADSVYFADAKKESAAGSYAESAMTSEGFEVTDEDIPF